MSASGTCRSAGVSRSESTGRAVHVTVDGAFRAGRGRFAGEPGEEDASHLRPGGGRLLDRARLRAKEAAGVQKGAGVRVVEPDARGAPTGRRLRVAPRRPTGGAREHLF